jgi:hypothetical protein
MYLSDRDILWAIEKGLLIIEPPSDPDPTSLDLHLDKVEQAKIWDVGKMVEENRTKGAGEPEVYLGSFKYTDFAKTYLIRPPDYRAEDRESKVLLRGNEVIVRPGGFLLWQTKGVSRDSQIQSALYLLRGRQEHTRPNRHCSSSDGSNDPCGMDREYCP